MFRPVPSLLAMLAAMLLASPSWAADLDEWNDEGGDSSFRSGYPTEPGDWAGLGDKDDPLHFEFGTRYWYSMGAMSITSSGSTLSTVDTSHVGEFHLRIEDHSTATFAKALGGYSFASNGSFNGSAGSGDINDGHIGYLGADFGWNPISDGNGSGMGPLVGYLYWNDSLNSGRTNFTTAQSADDISYDPNTGQTFLPGDSTNNRIDVHSLRLGVQGKMKMGDMFDVSGELVGVPYARVNGTVGVDDPTFSTAEYNGPAQFPYGGANGNISSMRSSITTVDGWGYGAMAEGWIGVHPTENWTVRVGGRAWYLQGTAETTYNRAFIGNPGDADSDGTYDTDPSFVNQGVISQSNPFSMFRYGLLAEATYAF